MVLFVIIISFFSFYLLYKLLNEYYFSLEQTSKTSNLDSNLILRQYKLDLKAWFMEIKSINPKLRQDQIAKELVDQLVLLNVMETMLKCFLFIESHQMVTKENKGFRIQTLMIIQIVSTTPKGPQMTSNG